MTKRTAPADKLELAHGTAPLYDDPDAKWKRVVQRLAQEALDFEAQRDESDKKRSLLVDSIATRLATIVYTLTVAEVTDYEGLRPSEINWLQCLRRLIEERDSLRAALEAERERVRGLCADLRHPMTGVWQVGTTISCACGHSSAVCGEEDGNP